MTTRPPSLDALWDDVPRNTIARFDPARFAGVARRYLEHAVAAGAPPASAVRLRMHGEIKLRLPKADEVIHWNRGFV